MNARLRELHAMKARIEREIQREEALMLRMAQLRDLVNDVLAKQSATVRATLVAVAAEHDLSVVDLMSPGKSTMTVAAARHVAAAVLRRQDLSYPEVGRILNRDHTTVLHSCRRVTESTSLAAAAERVETRLATEFGDWTTHAPRAVS